MKFLAWCLSCFAVFLSTSLMADDSTNPRVISPSEQQDLQVIVDKSLIHTGFFKNLMYLYASQIMEKTGKTMDQQELMKQFQQALQSPDIKKKLAEPYQRLFTAKEIHQIREIYENDAFTKLSNNSLEIAKLNHQAMKDLLMNIIANGGKEKGSGEIAMLELNQSNFAAEVKNSNIPVVLDFYADWCGPCKSMAPIFENLASAYAGRVKFAKVNSDYARELTREYGVTGLPTFVFIKNGKVVNTHVGMLSQSEFDAKVRSLLQN